MRYQVPLLQVRPAYIELRDELDAAYRRVMESGQYILGEEVAGFEAEFASYCRSAYCVTVANGLEALFLILRAYGIGAGDEVLVPANTFIATWLAVSHTGAKPIPVEPSPTTYTIDAELLAGAITPRTRAIVAVHLYGHPAAMDAIAQVAERYHLRVIEDAAQAHGARWRGLPTGGLADAAAFSFYPSKTLGAFGDGGAVTTNDEPLAKRLFLLRNYGSAVKHDHQLLGFNSRLDPLQAAFLRVRLRHLDEWNARRRSVANNYRMRLAAAPECVLPVVSEDAQSCWHLFVIRHARRTALRGHLAQAGIETGIHYPIPPHLSEAYSGHGWRKGDLPRTEELADTVLSLPMGPHLQQSQVDRVTDAVLDFCCKQKKRR